MTPPSCIIEDNEEKRELIKNFVDRCDLNHIQFKAPIQQKSGGIFQMSFMRRLHNSELGAVHSFSKSGGVVTVISALTDSI